MNQIEEMRRQGLSVTAISELTGYDRKAVRKYLAHPDLEPRYKPRPGRSTLLDPFKAHMEERLAAGVWNAVVSRELKEGRILHGKGIPTAETRGGANSGSTAI